MARVTAQPKQPDRVAAALRDQNSSQHRQQQQIPFLNNGRLLKRIAIAATATATAHHGLKRQPAGWLLTDVEGLDGRVSRTAWDSKTITLRNEGAASITVDVWIY